MTRGLRNRNPGNIRLSATKFKGEVASADKAFKQFRGMAWGYRAMFVVLNTYRKKHGLETVRQMINRWAPPVENHTDIYVDAVSRRAMLDADTPIDTQQREAMIPMVAAMSFVENGVAADWASVERGWELFEADLDLSATH
ncbi:MAG: structural protein P5 [Rikenellaceae bacterium]